jgi:hypothetical protein
LRQRQIFTLRAVQDEFLVEAFLRLAGPNGLMIGANQSRVELGKAVAKGFICKGWVRPFPQLRKRLSDSVALGFV